MCAAWPSRRRSAITGCIVYLVVAYLLLYPVLRSPVMADDLFNPFSQFDTVGSGPGAAVRFGWDGATDGASFRIVGSPIGALYNWVWLFAAARLGISMSFFYAVTKLVVYVLAAAAAAYAWRRMSRLTSASPVPFHEAFVWVSLMLFATVQIHAAWSNDPVANYPFAGYLGAAFGASALAAGARFGLVPTWRSAALATLVATASVLYYEINIGAVIGSFVIVLACAVERARTGIGAARPWMKGIVIPAVPAAFVLAGRFVTSPEAAQTYTGTTVRLDGAASTFGRGVLTTLPGAGWPRALDQLGHQLGVVFFVFGVTALVVVAMWWWLASCTTVVVQGHGDLPAGGDRADEVGTVDPHGDVPVGAAFGGLVQIACVAAVIGYAAFALGLQSITVKVQDEAPGVGYVYTWYAMTSMAMAMLLALVGRGIAIRWRAGVPSGLMSSAVMRCSLLYVALCFLLVQNTVNWRLAEQLSSQQVASRVLLDSYDDDVDISDRCAALVQWMSIRWPQYYVDGVVDGVQESFVDYFDEPFCPYGVGDE